MKRIILPNNIAGDDLRQNLTKERCPECGTEQDITRPAKVLESFTGETGIHNFTLQGEDSHTYCIYWNYGNYEELPIRIYATPNYEESRINDENLNEEDNFVSFSIHLKDNPVVTKNVKIDGELTVEKYLKTVRNFIEKHAVWARSDCGNLVEGEKEYR